MTEHPEWFHHRPDGTIKYAENPPKKYQDIYPLNFFGREREALWEEAKGILLFWIEQGVRIFRVDNPHTKPIAFWSWVIAEIQAVHPDVIFLAEAFTRPRVVQALAKVGFTQSYTYFTWRNFKQELIDYLTELTRGEMAEYFRGNFFANTPDILPPILQQGGPPAFRMRLALAATLSSVYGIYSGYELCENAAVPGTEEYLDSEKYEIKVRDWNAPGNIRAYVARLNRIRRENRALHEYRNLVFYESDDEHVLCYGKRSADGANAVLVAVNLDPFAPHEARVRVPLETLGIAADESFQAHDLISDERHLWRGPAQRVRLDPRAGARGDPPPRALRSAHLRDAVLLRPGGRAAPPPRPASGGRRAVDDLWYKDAVFYEVHVKAFQDSNDDGIGDFPGLTARLDYIQDLGVDCLWLLPVLSVPSPGRRLRHRRLPRGLPALRQDGGLRDLHRRGAPPRAPGDRGPRREPHVGQAPLVPVARGRPRTRRTATTTSGATPTGATRTRASSSWTRRSPTGRGIPTRRPTTGTGSSATSPT